MSAPSRVSQSRLRWRLFQPWNWPRWLLVMIVVSLPIVYFVSAVPVLRMAEEHGRPPWMARWLDNFYFPARQAAERIEMLEAIVEWESGLMDRIYGPPGITTDSIMDVIHAL